MDFFKDFKLDSNVSIITFILFVVSNIEAIQSQLKNIYTNTLSTLCPLPWLEEAGDVQYNFDDVFIPLRTIDIDIQQKTGDLSGPSERRDRQVYGQAENTSRLPHRNYVLRVCGDLSRRSNVRNMRTHHTRYRCENYNFIFLYTFPKSFY